VASARGLRRIALSFTGTTEALHFERTALKVRHIYATLAADGRTANLMLAPDEQALKCLVAPKAFVPNAWGRRGAATVTLSKVNPHELKAALQIAGRNAVAKTPSR
jgi:hypothetical protein